LPQQILWNKFHIRCAYFTPNCTWSLNYSVLVFYQHSTSRKDAFQRYRRGLRQLKGQSDAEDRGLRPGSGPSGQTGPLHPATSGGEDGG
jgi:hypothetical protein